MGVDKTGCDGQPNGSTNDMTYVFDEGAQQLRLVDTCTRENYGTVHCGPGYLTDDLYAEDKRQELLAMVA